MKTILIIIIALYFTQAHATYIPPYQMTIKGINYPCDYTVPKTFTGTVPNRTITSWACYSQKTPTATTYTTRGNGIARRATYLLDPTGKPIYEGNSLSCPPYPDVQVVDTTNDYPFAGWQGRAIINGETQYYDLRSRNDWSWNCWRVI